MLGDVGVLHSEVKDERLWDIGDVGIAGGCWGIGECWDLGGVGVWGEPGEQQDWEVLGNTGARGLS